jgi:CheY-like chemotaxis protein
MKKIQSIWLADDDDDDCLVFHDVLMEFENAPHLTCLKNGQELVDLMKSYSMLPDVVFLDVNMPVKGGMEALEEIKDDKQLNSIPIIILSTSVQPVAVEHAFRLGARLFIKKPDSFNDLHKILMQTLSLDLKKPAENKADKFVVRLS